MPAIDAETAYANGTLSVLTKGVIRNLIRDGHGADILPFVAVPIARLADNLRRMGRPTDADLVLRHAVHDGVDPSILVLAVAANTTASAVPPPVDQVVAVEASGALRVGPPAEATDLESTTDLANFLRDHL